MAENENPYAPPRANVSDEPPIENDLWSVIGRMIARFFWATGVSFVVFLILVTLVMPRNALNFGVMGSMFFAWLAGLVGACIPTKNKAGYIIPALLVSGVVAYLAARGTGGA